MTVNEPIAIIGSGCRFPGDVDSPVKLWALLKDPKDVQTKVPPSRWNADAFYHADNPHHGTTNVRHGYFLSGDVRAFDANFFNFKPHEAECMDPQQRLLLETVYDSFMAAGLKMEDMNGSDTAVYVGVMSADYSDILYHDLKAAPTYTATGSARSILANRISYAFNWQGPSMSIDTACSSSLVAVHHAVQALRQSESKVAIAAGTNLMFAPSQFIVESKLSMLSPSGRSRMWDAAGDGYARGEGIASIVLKTLKQALADGDHIECIIRETGVNQDGRTTGITMPSHLAQEALIRQTYAKAGLDIHKPSDRCQYFEAHGTGTPAGDPQEAQAISRAFFSDPQPSEEEGPLFVGSVKTIIGHTEGTAGLAGLLRASLAIQHAVIPPNMHFDNLSPKVAPFYNGLFITKEAVPWPQNSVSEVRRASVNSFGFGGTNAHAILESFRASDVPSVSADIAGPITPLIISAHTESALRKSMSDLNTYLEANPAISLRDLTWTFLERRSQLPFRRAIYARDVSNLKANLESEMTQTKADSRIIKADVRKTPRLLGVFTGQGAQWATMGRSLLQHSITARLIIAGLDRSLATLPRDDRPEWSIHQELLRDDDTSRINEATFSQPLCTAIQILLVDLLSSAGLQFSAVVGHSSGEIACAYASGCITASDAIRIAYYRGLVARHAVGSNGSDGAMLAVGTTLEDAQDLCDLDAFDGLVTVAACNAADSVTLSGDIEAIRHAKVVLEDEQKFVRMLKVNKAYHSHHMQPCATPYVRALSSCKIGSRPSEATQTTWHSSVSAGRIMAPNVANAHYWKDNMVSPVYFMQALEAALETSDPFDAVVEVGPHPALKGPAKSTMDRMLGFDVAYLRCLQRGSDDVEAFSTALGSLWELFGADCINFSALETLLHPENAKPKLLKDLPTYPWDHSRSFWFESRLTNSFLNRKTALHPLLGDVSSTSTKSTLQWNNRLVPREIPWLDGHQLQGQVVFPAAGFAVMAMEAALTLPETRSVELIEVLDLTIGKAIAFNDENDSVEVQLTLNVNPDIEGHTLETTFNCDSSLGKEKSLSWSAGGRVRITFGEPNPHALPDAQPEIPHLTPVNLDKFYSELATVGYGYTKDFRGMEELRRTTNFAAGSLHFPNETSTTESTVLHPAPLDVAFQAFIAAFCAPGDGRLWSLHVPTSIKRIAVNPLLCSVAKAAATPLSFCSNIASEQTDAVSGDVGVFLPDSRRSLIQVEELSFKPFSAPTASDDRLLFSEWKWGPLDPDDVISDSSAKATAEEAKAASIMERMTYFYIKNLLSNITEEDREISSLSMQHFLNWADHLMRSAAEGSHHYFETVWATDTEQSLAAIVAPLIHRPDVAMIQRLGNCLDQIVREEVEALEIMTKDNLLTNFYREALGFRSSYQHMKHLVSQIAHRHANLDVLEIGAGTGGCTRTVLPPLGDSFNSYTYTDISPAFFEDAQKEFDADHEQMRYKVLDISKPIASQGFSERAYDLIVASNVLHATQNLSQTMQHCRQLLRPGGRVAILEITSPEQNWISFIFGTLPGWWEGVDDGRTLRPTISTNAWDDVLQNAGFSVMDSCSEQIDSSTLPLSVFSAQATDAVFDKISNPNHDSKLSSSSSTQLPIVVVGGESQSSSQVLSGLPVSLGQRIVIRVADFSDLLNTVLPAKCAFLVLSELDSELFSHLDEDSFDGLKIMFFQATQILWVTENAYDENPHQMMVIGMCRSLRLEYPECQLQILDLDNAITFEPEMISRLLLRLERTQDFNPKQMTWTCEPELRLQSGRLFIPRLQLDEARNGRYNAHRRRISRAWSTNVQQNASLTTFDNCYDLVAHSNSAPPQRKPKELQEVEVLCSTVQAIRAGHAGFLYVVCGRSSPEGRLYIGLSETNSFKSRLLKAVYLSSTSVGLRTILDLATTELLAYSMLSNVLEGSNILVLGSSAKVQFALLRQAKPRRISVFFIAEHQETTSYDGNWTFVHARATHQALRQVLPSSIAAFHDLTGEVCPGSLSARIRQCLPSHCSAYDRNHFAQGTAHLHSASDSIPFEQLMKAAQGQALVCDVVPPALNLRDAPFSRTHVEHEMSLGALVDWSNIGDTRPRVVGIQSTQLFEDFKTYILVGLTGDLGRSICRWMIKHGARYIVLLSRSPKIDNEWFEHMAQEGAVVEARSMNVSDADSVNTVLKSIENELPHIAGVAHGPLVLQDAMFENMDLEAMEAVLEPKVKGAQNLEKYFRARQLDFFVYFSSLVGAGGNPGQSNYAAANAYLSGAAARRRKQGLAAACINIGAVHGAGFIARAARDSDYSLNKFMFLPTSEQDLHTQFAEAIVAGQPDSGASWEITSGMAFMDERDRESIPFFDDPRLANFRNPERLATMETSGDNAAALPVKARIQAATSLEEAEQMIVGALMAKLNTALQLSSVDELDPGMPLTDQGVDSLVAVTIRTWFSKELHVDMPVLKVLGGASVTDLASEAVAHLPVDIAPQKPQSDDTATLTAPNNTAPAVLVTSDEPYEDASAVVPTSDTESVSASDDAHSLVQVTPCTEISEVDGPGLSNDQYLDDIDKTDIGLRIAPMSHAQSRFWLLRNLVHDRTTSNVTIGMWLDGELDIDRLSRSIQKLAKRHEILRSRFFAPEDLPDKPMQVVMPESKIALEHRQHIDQVQAMRTHKELEQHEYDLESGETCKMMLLSETATKHYFIVAYHHMIGDGWSFETLINELHMLYEGRLLDAPQQYIDYTLRQQAQLERGELEEDKRFWQESFTPLPPVLPLLPLATTSSRTNNMQWDYFESSTRLAPIVASRIKDRSRKHKAQSFHFYLTAYYILLARLTETHDLCIGLADANRNDERDASSLGLFINLLPVRLAYDASQTFGDAIVHARNQSRESLGHSKLPFDVILQQLDVLQNASHAPLFQAFLDYRQGQSESGQIGSANITGVEMSRGRTSYDISIEITEDPTRDPLVNLKLQKGSYTQEDADALLKCYTHVLTAFSRNPAVRVGDPQLFSKSDLEAAQKLGVGRQLVLRREETLVDIVDSFCASTPDECALQGPDYSMSYAQMALRVNAIAAKLLQSGIQIGSYVGVLQSAHADVICSILAILRVAAVYVPLDPAWPESRLRAVLKNCHPQAILHDHMLNKHESLLLDSPNLVSMECITESRLVKSVARPEHAAVLLHTSGTTGLPKALLLTHGGLHNNIQGTLAHCQIPKVKTLQQSAFTFDLSLNQIFVGLASGGSVYVLPSDQRLDPNLIIKTIGMQHIAYTEATPSEYRSWLSASCDELATLRVAKEWRFARALGEVIPPALLLQVRSLELDQLRFFCAYGPAETTISSSTAELDYKANLSARMPIGTTLPNYATYIVDENMRTVPAGWPGQILIGGPSVGLGYLNDPMSTQEKFIKDHLATPDMISRGHTTLYCSGDRGRLTKEGMLHFDGRMDGNTQIKLRGFRIDLMDIENAIIASSKGTITSAVVSDRGEDVNRFLVAHLVFSSSVPGTSRKEVMQLVLSTLPLPNYMRPAMTFELDRIPLTTNGKLDRKAVNATVLPAHEPASKTGRTELTDHEQEIWGLWGELLPSEAIQAISPASDTDFVACGGNSLLMVRLQALFRSRLQVDVPLAELFAGTTLGEMATHFHLSSIRPADFNLDAEAELDLTSIQDFSVAVKANTSRAVTKEFSVALTGATGFLGGKVLEMLIQHPDVRRVHCLGVRTSAEDGLQRAIGSSEKVKILLGDLREPLFGLCQADAERTAAISDVLIHCGATRSFWDSYDNMKQVNVLSTKEAVRLSATYRIPILLPSSDSVGGLDLPNVQLEDIGGYVLSKDVSEQVLKNAIKHFDVPSTIIRMSSKLDGEESEPHQHEEAALQALLDMEAALGARLDFQDLTGHVGFTPVADVASKIVDATISAARGTPVSHLTCGSKCVLSAEKFRKYEIKIGLEKDQRPSARLPAHLWISEAKKNGFPLLITAQEYGVGGVMSSR